MIPERKMKVIILTHAIAPDEIGGSETQTLGLATELARNNRVVVMTRRSGRLPAVEKKDGFLIKRFGRSWRFPVPLFRFTWSVLRDVRRNRSGIDLLFAKAMRHGFIACLAGRLSGLPVAILVESEREYASRNYFFRQVLKLAAKSAVFITQTPSLRNDLMNKTGIPSAVLPNGITLGKDKASGTKAVFVGRLVSSRLNDKGVRFLIEAVRDQPYGTLIIGGGPEVSALKAQAGVSPNITFMGEVRPGEVRKYLLQGFALVLPSVHGEGLPNVLLEAMAVGLPVIATRTAGIPDVVDHGRTGFLIPPADSLAIRSCLGLLWNDKNMREKMSAACLREAERYDWARVIRAFEETFHRIVSDFRDRASK